MEGEDRKAVMVASAPLTDVVVSDDGDVTSVKLEESCSAPGATASTAAGEAPFAIFTPSSPATKSHDRNRETERADGPLSPINCLRKQGDPTTPPNLIEIEDDNSEGHAPWNASLATRPASTPAASEGLTPTELDKQDDGVSRFVHEDTSKGHYLLNSAALDSPSPGLRYNLTKGKRGMDAWMRRASDQKFTKPKTKPVVTQPDNPPVQSFLESTSFKIFLLLLQPKSKIFELIQVIYCPCQTTIGDILDMIPSNATEPALGAQTYIGLCRPKDGSEIADANLMASSLSSGMDCAKITLGEILVAIPEGFTGELCSKISQPILANPKITKLLKRSNPLAPRRKGEKRGSRRRRRRSKESTSRVETVAEEEEESRDSMSLDSTKNMEKAMKHAAEIAAMSNAAHIQPREADLQSDRSESPKSFASVESPRSFGSFERQASFESEGAGGLNSNGSVNSVFTFQSTSKRIPRRLNSRKRHRRSKRKTMLMRAGFATFVFMVVRFLTDPNAESSADTVDTPAGAYGILQILIVFLGLVKMQRYFLSNGANVDKCPFLVSTKSWLRSIDGMHVSS